MNKQTFQYLPIAIAWLLFAAFSHYFYFQIGDDSFIYFRYVERAVNGYWSWADYSGNVEGYSSPLWYGLLVLLAKLGLGIEASARALGLLFAALTLQGCWRLGQYFQLPKASTGMACVLLVLNQGFHYWSTSGLETSLYMALFIWSCLGIVSAKFWLLPTALIAVARPEGPFLLIALIVAIAVFRRPLLSWKNLALLLLPLAICLLIRAIVYGDILPNTYYAKATGDKLPQIVSGTVYSSPVLLPLLAAWGLWFLKRQEAWAKDIMVVLGMITMLVGIVLLGGGDWMFFMRLLLPSLALLWVALAVLWHYGLSWQRVLLTVATLLLLVISVQPQNISGVLLGKQLPLASYQEGNMTHASIELAKDIEQQFGDKKLLVAVNHAGALPYALARHDMIDMVGLNDKHIAKAEGGLHSKHDAAYVLSLKPDLIVLNSRTKPGTDGVWYHKGYWQGETALVKHSDFVENYQATDLVRSWQWQIPFPYAQISGKRDVESWILVYQRKNN